MHLCDPHFNQEKGWFRHLRIELLVHEGRRCLPSIFKCQMIFQSGMYENFKNIGEFDCFTCPHVSQLGGGVSLLQLTCSIGSEVASRYRHDLNFPGDY